MTDTEPRAGRDAHKPVVRADLTALIDAAGGWSHATQAEVAASTATAVLRAGRDAHVACADVVTLAEQVGLETLGQLWREAEPVSLPGALWTLYVLRQWCHTHGVEVCRYWREGAPFAPADAVVAGLGEAPSPDDCARVADAIMRSAFQGDFAVCLERAAAVFRVVAAGRTASSADDQSEAERAARNLRTAEDLRAAARHWRAGSLR